VTEGRLHGRTAERRLIDRSLERAALGRFAAVGIEGEPGSGKTALCEYATAAAAAAGFDVVSVSAADGEADLPLAGLSLLVHPLLAWGGTLSPHQRRLLGGEGSAVEDRFMLGAAVLAALSAAAEQRPLLVVLDDVQWLDAVSADALSFALRRLDVDTVSVLLAGRPGSLHTMPVADPAVLGGLERQAALDLVTDRAPDVTGAVAATLVNATGGVPLALVEAVGQLSAAQRRGNAPLPEPLPIGGRLLELYRAQLAPFPGECLLALGVLAAAGSADDLVSPALADLGIDLAVLEPAEAGGVVTSPAAALTFRHPLIRQAALDLLSPAQRRRVHQALADAASGDPERYAGHLSAAVLGPSEPVAQALLAAAQEAERRGGLSAAAGILERAALATPPGEVRFGRLAAAAEAQLLAGQVEVALAHLDEIIAASGDRVLRADSALTRTQALLWAPDGSHTAQTAKSEALHVAESDPCRASAGLTQAAQLLLSRGEIDTAVQLARDAHRYATGDRIHTLGAVAVLANALISGGQRDEAAALLDTATIDSYIEWAGRSADLPGYVYASLASVGQALGISERDDEAALVLTPIVEDYRRRFAPHGLVFPLSSLSENLWRTGRWVQAGSLGEEALALASQTGQTVLGAFVATFLARIRAGQGDSAASRELIEQAFAVAAAAGITSVRLYALQALGFLELGASRLEEAIPVLREADAIAQQYGYRDLIAIPYSVDLIEALIRCGQRDEAEAAVARHRHLAATLHSPWGTATANRYQAMMLATDGRSDQAADLLFREAIALHPTGSFDEARTRLCWGERLQGHDRPGSLLQLERAAAVFDTLGAQPWAQQARTVLTAIGAGSAPPARPALQQLTARELQIALAVADGLSNRAAAAALFVSPKTVEHHLGRVYTKLNVTSRTQLANLIHTAL
jgi:DNA-binding CsgD family transcriptional regulator/tetratricopeptide (TPR) repeat protein